jgi:hypothetical protein
MEGLGRCLGGFRTEGSERQAARRALRRPPSPPQRRAPHQRARSKPRAARKRHAPAAPTRPAPPRRLTLHVLRPGGAEHVAPRAARAPHRTGDKLAPDAHRVQQARQPPARAGDHVLAVEDPGGEREGVGLRRGWGCCCLGLERRAPSARCGGLERVAAWFGGENGSEEGEFAANGRRRRRAVGGGRARRGRAGRRARRAARAPGGLRRAHGRGSGGGGHPGAARTSLRSAIVGFAGANNFGRRRIGPADRPGLGASDSNRDGMRAQRATQMGVLITAAAQQQPPSLTGPTCRVRPSRASRRSRSSLSSGALTARQKARGG